MASIGSFLFGPRYFDPFGQAKDAPRSRVMSASTLFALQDRVRTHTDALHAEGQRFNPPGAEFYDSRTGGVLTREQILEAHSYQLRQFYLNGAGEGISVENGPVRLHGASSPIVPGTINADLLDILEGTSRPRVIWRRLWVLAPWLIAVPAVLALVLSVRDGEGVPHLLALSTVLALAVLAAGTASVLIFRWVEAYRPPSIVRPYRWREIVATRLTVLVGIGGVVLGAVAGAVITRLLAPAP